MNCGCTKHLGCFIPEQMIDFGMTAPFGDDYIFQIFGPSGYSEQTFTFLFGQVIEIPFSVCSLFNPITVALCGSHKII